MFVETICGSLRQQGIAAYSISEHIGECESPFVVVESGGCVPTSFSLVTEYIDIAVFYPVGNHAELHKFIKIVKQALKEIRALKFQDEQSAEEIDEEKNAYMVSLEYHIYKRREG